MKLHEMIRMTGSIPKTCEFENGSKMHLDFSKRHDNKIVATMWHDDHIYCFAVGDTEQMAHDRLKEKIMLQY